MPHLRCHKTGCAFIRGKRLFEETALKAGKPGGCLSQLPSFLSPAVVLLQPSLIPELLKCCTSMGHHDYQVFSLDLGNLKGLPVVSAPLLTQRMGIIGIANREGEANSTIESMKALEVIYSLGRHRGQDKEKFFVPFLAMEALSDSASFKWDKALETKLCSDATLVLYASLHNHATDHLFYRVIASMLNDAVANPSVQVRCFVNLGCREAMLPLFYSDGQSEMVLLRYHPVQNFIEFRKEK